MIKAWGSELWSGVNSGLRWAGRRGWIVPTRLPCRVISVGNIEAGGTGKTPLVARIAHEAADRGLRVCVLTRGYGGNWEKTGGLLGPGLPAPLTTDCGDEPALLRELAPQAWIAIGADRLAQFARLCTHLASLSSGRSAMESVPPPGTGLAAPAVAGPDLVILDDGFQNRHIHKDVELVALTSHAFGETWFRDRPSALDHAQILVWTKGETTPPGLPPGVPLVRAEFRVPPETDPTARWLLVCGVGSPDLVIESARRAGYQILDHRFYTDHAAYEVAQVRDLLQEARGRNLKVAITGKDWVKWRDLGVARSEVTVWEPELVFSQGRADWERVLWGI